MLASLVYRQHRDEVESRAGKRQRVAYVYGNYPRYYSYRLSDPTFDEPRLQVGGPRAGGGSDGVSMGVGLGEGVVL